MINRKILFRKRFLNLQKEGKKKKKKQQKWHSSLGIKNDWLCFGFRGPHALLAMDMISPSH